MTLGSAEVKEEHAHSVIRGHLQLLVGVGQQRPGRRVSSSLLHVFPVSQFGVSHHGEALLVEKQLDLKRYSSTREP
ncbi:hypothetical protein EYF80_009810 [Liparis tanakae]|uniref:Uncharacterized protein n=1 Tax=Liparis tanakae TaxID=230148 RepID=A0A4Z2IRV8_9TELE|nr:hypothetical protein EYF80_009810 [Liparis tanakae]